MPPATDHVRDTRLLLETFLCQASWLTFPMSVGRSRDFSYVLCTAKL